MASDPPRRGALQVRTAGFWRRTLALLVDSAFLGALWLLLAWALRRPLGLDHLPETRIIGVEYVLEIALSQGSLLVPLLAVEAVVLVLYFTVLQAIRGWTPGKLLLDLRVIDSQGRPPSLLRSLLRSLGFLLSGLLLGLGFLWVGLDRQRRALHDYLASTYVVSRRSLRS